MERSRTVWNDPERSGTIQNVLVQQWKRTFWNAKERSGTFQTIKNDLNSPCLHTKTQISKERSKAIQNVLERTRTFFFTVLLWNVPNYLYLKSLVMTHLTEKIKLYWKCVNFYDTSLSEMSSCSRLLIGVKISFMLELNKSKDFTQNFMGIASFFQKL